jgi:DNA polymerase-1
MIRIDTILRDQKWQSRLLLQVHDELVLEAPPEEAQALRGLAKREMESAAALAVPLLVETGAGKNWRDAK